MGPEIEEGFKAVPAIEFQLWAKGTHQPLKAQERKMQQMQIANASFC